MEVANELGVPLADEKTEGPSTILTFLGTVMDTNLGIARLPVDKLVDLLSLILSFFTEEKSNLA